MDDNRVFARTPKGRQEIESRAFRLAFKLRSVLILVDGVSPLSVLARKAAGMGDLKAALEELLAGGFIRDAEIAPAAPTPEVAATDLGKLKAYLEEFVLGLFGSDAGAFVAQVRSASTFADLQTLVAQCRGWVESIAGQKKAEEFDRTCRELLRR